MSLCCLRCVRGGSPSPDQDSPSPDQDSTEGEHTRNMSTEQVGGLEEEPGHSQAEEERENVWDSDRETEEQAAGVTLSPGHVIFSPGHVTLSPGHVTLSPDHVTSETSSPLGSGHAMPSVELVISSPSHTSPSPSHVRSSPGHMTSVVYKSRTLLVSPSRLEPPCTDGDHAVYPVPIEITTTTPSEQPCNEGSKEPSLPSLEHTEPTSPVPPVAPGHEISPPSLACKTTKAQELPCNSPLQSSTTMKQSSEGAHTLPLSPLVYKGRTLLISTTPGVEMEEKHFTAATCKSCIHRHCFVLYKWLFSRDVYFTNGPFQEF